eukprot:366365-Chlamydomonas_euryale.AAC.8
MSVAFNGLYNDRSCAQLANSHGAELFAVFGDDDEMCYVMLGNEQYLKDVGFNVPNDPAVGVDCDIPVYFIGGCTAEPTQGPVTVGSPCTCPVGAETPVNVDVLCFRDENLGSAGGCRLEALSPWQRRCVCSDASLVYVEGRGCVPYGAVTSDELAQVVTTDGSRDAVCLQGKKLSMCLNDIGTLGTFGDPAPGTTSVFELAVAGMPEDAPKLMAAYAATGFVEDAETCDFFIGGDERVGWTLTASTAGGTISEKNNRYQYSNTEPGSVSIVPIPSTNGKIMRYESAGGDVGYVLDVTMPDANADSVYMSMTVTNNLATPLTDIAFVWVQDPDQGRCPGLSPKTYESVFYVENSVDSVRQVIAYEDTNRRPVVALTSCSAFRAGTVAQHPADDLKLASFFVSDLPKGPTSDFPLDTSPTVDGNHAMYMLFKSASLLPGASVKFEWTMSFYTVGAVPAR